MSNSTKCDYFDLIKIIYSEGTIESVSDLKMNALIDKDTIDNLILELQFYRKCNWQDGE